MIDEALWAYSSASTGETTFTNSTDIQDAIRGLKVGQAPGTNGIPNGDLKHLPQSSSSSRYAKQLFELTTSMEACPSDLRFETQEEPGTALILSSHKSTGHDWQVVREDRTHEEPNRSKRVRAP